MKMNFRKFLGLLMAVMMVAAMTSAPASLAATLDSGINDVAVVPIEIYHTLDEADDESLFPSSTCPGCGFGPVPYSFATFLSRAFCNVFGPGSVYIVNYICGNCGAWWTSLVTIWWGW
jgi:hypothetical protein